LFTGTWLLNNAFWQWCEHLITGCLFCSYHHHSSRSGWPPCCWFPIEINFELEKGFLDPRRMMMAIDVNELLLKVFGRSEMAKRNSTSLDEWIMLSLR
jgi:hypothetical protein